MSDAIYIQYGCGWSAPDGWKNFDASPTLRYERLPLFGRMYTRNRDRFPENVCYGDIVKGLPVSLGSCKAIYCSHILEHLALEDFREALRNTYKVLQPGGYFRLVLPDLEFLVSEYVNNSADQAAHELMVNSGLGRDQRGRGIREFVRSWLGNSNHLWMWDFRSLRSELEKVGFTDIRRAVFGDAAVSKFNEVEDEQRWTNCLGIECNAPI